MQGVESELKASDMISESANPRVSQTTSQLTSTSTSQNQVAGVGSNTLSSDAGHAITIETGKDLQVVGEVTNISSYPIVMTRSSDIKKGCMQDTVVALKILRRYASVQDHGTALQDFYREALLWSTLDHPHILPLIGIFFLPPSLYPAMVSKFMPNGTLNNYLGKHPDSDKVHLLSGVASGISYLHTLPAPIIHGDIRGMNILVDYNGEPLVTDFGCARHPEFFEVTQPLCLFRWSSPESLRTGQCAVTVKTDVYSFACLCIEVFTGKLPFQHLNDGAVVVEVLVRNGRPSRPSGSAAHQLSDSIWKMMEKSWALDPSDRPAMTDVHRLLSSL